MNSISDLRQVCAVTEARYHAAEARMAALRQTERALAAQVESLHAAALTRFRTRDVTDAALLAGVDLRWEHWIAERIQQLNSRRALVLAKIEEERGILLRAFGSNMALEEHLKIQRRAAFLAAQRKAQRDS